MKRIDHPTKFAVRPQRVDIVKKVKPWLIVPEFRKTRLVLVLSVTKPLVLPLLRKSRTLISVALNVPLIAAPDKMLTESVSRPETE